MFRRLSRKITAINAVRKQAILTKPPPTIGLPDNARSLDAVSGEDVSEEDFWDQETLLQRILYYRHLFHLALEKPSSSRLASVIAAVVLVFIVVSVILILLETLLIFQNTRARLVFAVFEMLLTVVFTFEYALRLCTSKNPFRWAVGPMALIDALAIIPIYISALLFYMDSSTTFLLIQIDASVFSAFRVIRLIRVARVVKFGRYASGIKLITASLRKSADELVMTGMLMTIIVILSSSLIYYAERGTWDEDQHQWIRSNGDVSPYSSIPESFYWSIVTITTVGYGDIVPITIPGRIIACCTMIIGVVSISFPITIIGSNFSMEWHASREMKKIEEALKSAGEIDGEFSPIDVIASVANSRRNSLTYEVPMSSDHLELPTPGRRPRTNSHSGHTPRNDVVIPVKAHLGKSSKTLKVSGDSDVQATKVLMLRSLGMRADPSVFIVLDAERNVIQEGLKINQLGRKPCLVLEAKFAIM